MSLEALIIQLEAVDAASKPIQQVADSIEGLNTLSKSTAALGQSLTDVGKTMTTRVTAPIVAGLGLAAKTAIDFESSLADVSKVTGLTGGELAALSQQALNLTRTIPMSATEMLALIEAGAQLGIPREQLMGFAETAAVMGTAFDISGNPAGEAMARLMNTFALGVDEVALMGDAMNHLSANTATSASQLVEITSRAGGAARTFGLSATQTAAVAAAFGEFAPNAESAATAMNSILPLLNTASRGTARFQAGLAAAGFEASAFEQMVREDAAGALQALVEQLGALDGQARSAAISDMFGTGIDAQVIGSLAANSGKLGTALGLVADQSSLAGSMQAEFATKAGTTANQMQLLRNGLSEIGVNIGSAILPALNELITAITPMVQGFAKFAAANPGIIKVAAAIALVLAVVGPALIVIGQVMTAIGAVMGALAFIKGAILVVVGVAGAAIGPVLLVIAVVAALAAAAFLIIKNWEPIKAFFARVWESIKEAFSRAKAFVLEAISSMASRVLSILSGLAGQAFAAGASIVRRIADGIRSAIGAVTGAVGAVVNRIRDMLPGSPVALGPLRVLNNIENNPGAQIVQMLSEGIRAAAPTLQQAMGDLGSGAVLEEGLRSPGRGGGPGGTTVVNNTFNISGVASAGEAEEVAEVFEERVRRVMEDLQRNQRRVSYA